MNIRISPLSQKTLLREQAEAGSGGGEQAEAGSGGGEQAQAEAPDFSFVPDDFRGEDGTPDTTRFRETYDHMAARLAQIDERDVPDAPDGYEFGLPEDIDYGDLELPEGWEPAIDTDNPLFQELGTVLHEIGAPKDAAPKLLGLLAKNQAHVASEMQKAARAEMEALGPQYESRLRTVQRTLETKLPDEGLRTALMDAVTTADGVRALEKLLGAPGQRSPGPNPAAQGMEEMKTVDRLKAIHSQRMNQRRSA